MKLLLTILILLTSLQAREVAIENKIASLYISFFNRAPDQAGLSYWTSLGRAAETNGESSLDVLKQLSAGFATHPTFTSTYDSMGDEEFVQAIYQNSLGREGDAGGVAYWKGLLTSGKSRSDMVAEFMELSLTLDLTPENFPSLSTEELNAAIERQDLITNKAEVAVYFTNTLGTQTNLDSSTNAMNPYSLAQDAAYIASQRVIADVGLDTSTVSSAKEKVDTVKDDEDSIAQINNSWDNLVETCIQVITYATNPDTEVCTEFATPCDVPSGWTTCQSETTVIDSTISTPPAVPVL